MIQVHPKPATDGAGSQGLPGHDVGERADLAGNERQDVSGTFNV